MDDLAAAPRAPVVELPAHAGEPFLAFLERLHATFRPETYLEIGVNEGDSLRLAQCKSIAIDPDASRLHDVFAGKPALSVFQTGSDQFFRHHDPRAILGQEVDLALIDGMHWWEFVLRDFINIERSCRRNSIVALHDCVPTNVYTAERENDGQRRLAMGAPGGIWLGDCWKAVLALKAHRPDLHLLVVDPPPRGLVLVTNLDPDSRVLADRYFAICREMEGLDLLGYGLDRLHREFQVRSTTEFGRWQDLSGRFVL